MRQSQEVVLASRIMVSAIMGKKSVVKHALHCKATTLVSGPKAQNGSFSCEAD